MGLREERLPTYRHKPFTFNMLLDLGRCRRTPPTIPNQNSEAPKITVLVPVIGLTLKLKCVVGQRVYLE